MTLVFAAMLSLLMQFLHKFHIPSLNENSRAMGTDNVRTVRINGWSGLFSLYSHFEPSNEPLLRNGRLSTEVISMVTNTENHPITRNG
jgi:hypothetical protein